MSSCRSSTRAGIDREDQMPLDGKQQISNSVQRRMPGAALPLD